MADPLAVWLYGSKVAEIASARDRLTLAYTEIALDNYSLGQPVLSFSLPLRPEPFPHATVRSFIDGLLPEGETRQAIARGLHLMSDDTYGIIRELGRDCAGAIVIQPAPDPPPPRATTNTAEPLNEDQVLQLLSNLRSSPLGASTRVRVSLAGIQEKLLLTRMTDGHWGRPVDGTPSTHILKPEAERFPNTVENEGYCMRVARHLGLRSASVETTMVGEKKVLVVERYDRKVGPGGGVERIHQEDLCQALALPPQRKYQEDGGPSLRKVADLYQSAAGPESLDDLLRTATLNVALGNGDAHGKNFSILIADDGSLKPAPLYDVLSTRPYDILDLAMYVDNVRRMHEVTLPRLVNEAASWGMSRERADAITTDVLVRLPDAMEAAREETVDLPASMLSSIQSQVTGLRA